jgi:LCP family protein required for cell wall assembly
MSRLARNRNIKRSRRARWLQYVLIVLLVGGLVAGVVGFKSISAWAQWHYATWTMRDTREAPAEGTVIWDGPKEPLNFVCIGIDRGSNKGETGWCRSDVLMFVSIDFKNKRVALVSIPRDTKVTIAGYGTEKINAAHSLYGPAGAIDAVKSLLGVSAIHHYVEVDFEAFKGIVDAIGGVPVHMDYEIRDPKVGCLGAGDIMLTGKDALVLCRSRDLPNGDMDRIANQQKFLKAMAQTAINKVRNVDDIQRVLNAIVPYLVTDMPGGDFLTLAKYLQGMKIEDIQMATIPGHDQAPSRSNDAWYFVHDPVGTAAIMDSVIKYCMVIPPAEDPSAGQVTLEDPADLPLMVLNGAGKQGIAAQVADILRNKGYAPATGTAENVYEQTIIYVEPGYSSIANQVARDFWGLKNPLVKVDQTITAAQGAKVVVVIGRDYTGS